MKNIKLITRFAALVCAFMIAAGSMQTAAQTLSPPPKMKTPPQTVILRIYEGVIFINPASAEQLLKQDTKKLKYVQNNVLTLNAADAVEQKDGEYVFKIGFVVSAEPVGANQNFADKDKWQNKIYGLPEFINRLKIGNRIIGEQKLKFTAEQSREAYIYGRAQPVITTIRLPAGKNRFMLALDDDHILIQPKDYTGWKKYFVIEVKP